MNLYIAFAFCFIFHSSVCFGQESGSSYTLIAHRGGIVGANAPENSRAALQEAIDRDFYMVEIDMRLTKDSVLITHHDSHFQKYFDTERLVSDMTWDEISKLQHQSGYRVLKLEEVLAHCAGKIRVMLDNKISGMDEKLFGRVIGLLKKYGLYEHALMIGSTESTEFFTGKVRLSCTRAQLSANEARADYSPDHYYLFARDISKDDVLWAKKRGILTVAAINSFAFDAENLQEAARLKTEELKHNGVSWFQIDGIFAEFFSE